MTLSLSACVCLFVCVLNWCGSLATKTTLYIFPHAVHCEQCGTSIFHESLKKRDRRGDAASDVEAPVNEIKDHKN